MGTFTGLTFAHNKCAWSAPSWRRLLRNEVRTRGHSGVHRRQGQGDPQRRRRLQVRLWNQMQADIYNLPIELTKTSEATSLGAAMCAAVGHGFYKDLSEAADHMVKLDKRYDPIPST